MPPQVDEAKFAQGLDRPEGIALTADGKSQGESPRNERKMMSSEEVARRTYNAAKKKKRDLVLTRDGILAIFFNKLVPSWVDRKIYERLKKEPGSPLK